MKMESFFQKVSSYNLFNYLLPGTLFAVLTEKFTHYSFLQTDIVTAVFLYYFLGLILSRLGSLILEPFLKLIRFLKFAPYSDFVAAATKSEKLDVLSEVNNSYRTLCTMFLVLIAMKVYESYESILGLSRWANTYGLLLLLLLIFLISYKKQTTYIRRHAEAVLKNE